jgi:hypothetical protein
MLGHSARPSLENDPKASDPALIESSFTKTPFLQGILASARDAAATHRRNDINLWHAQLSVAAEKD